MGRLNWQRAANDDNQLETMIAVQLPLFASKISHSHAPGSVKSFTMVNI